MGVESEPYSENWSLVKALDGFALDRIPRYESLVFFFVASEVKVMCLGAVGAKKNQRALNRILKVSQ